MMQEQSQAPALGGRDTQDSFEALEGLMKYAKARSSHQILLMTWGYVNGDAVKHPAIFPDYHAMQVRSPLSIYLAPNQHNIILRMLMHRVPLIRSASSMLQRSTIPGRMHQSTIRYLQWSIAVNLQHCMTICPGLQHV